MRVTSGMYYDSLYKKNDLNLNKRLFDVNKQIASGLKIQYASDGVRTFAETMRLDNEITVLSQVKQSTESGLKVSDQTDSIMNEFSDLTNRIRTLLIQASNDTNDETSRNAIAQELRGIEKNFRSLANTSINGRYLFSGSALDVAPIDENGEYQGNSEVLNAFVGSNNQQQFNISGAELFLGENPSIEREVSTNIQHKNLLQDYPALQSSAADAQELNASSTMRQFMGDTDNSATPANTYYFYARGVKSDGTAFAQQLSFSDNDKVSDLLDNIGKLYGNTGSNKVVDVTLNSNHEIVVKDRINGSSKLDLHLVGAVDFSGGGAANVANIDLLDGGETNFDEIINPTTPPANPLFVKEFTRSGFTPAAGAATNIEGLVYDRAMFTRDASTLSSNVAQVQKSYNSAKDEVLQKNAFATPSTRLSDVFDLSQGTPDTLDGTKLRLVGDTIAGAPSSYDITINLDSAGATFTDNNTATTYNIYNMDATRVATPADDVTYQQLLDVINMAVTGNLPASASDTDYDTAIKNANVQGNSYLTYDGKIAFKDLTTGNTKATLSLYDTNSGSFGGDTSVASFQANSAIMVRDPKNDFFKSLDDMIRSVEEYKLYPDAKNKSERVIGMENAIARLDDMQDHLLSMHSKVGAQSNTLQTSLERVQILDISTKSLRSSVIDTDLAEASLTLQQLTTNYQAMLSTVGKISQLSLVNYL